MAEDDILFTRGKIYGATLEILKEVIEEQGLDVGTEALTRPRAVAIVDAWLTKEVEGADKGKTALVALGMNFDASLKLKKTPETKGKTSDPLPALWRKDFKIFGTITELPTGGLSYVSLNRQIKAGTEKGHSETEVIEGVIRAISPGVKLRSYLEGKQGLSLKELKGILQSHFREQTATELYKKLCNATQTTTETALEFVMRTLDLKQRVLAASEEDKDVPYDTAMVEKMFLHAVITGLRDDNVRHRLEPVLVAGIDDVTILSAVNQITLTEAEHNSKVRSKINVNMCSDNMTKLENEVKELKAQLNKLTIKTDRTSTNQNFRNSKRSQPRRKCNECENSDSNCDHCFKCGSREHFAKGCRSKALNPQRSLQKGDQ